MTVTISAFRWVPEFAWGNVKDLRVRWALEEAGVPYEVELIDPPISRDDQYRQWQPFGQVPAYRDDTVTLFESGAIVLHLAKTSEALAPQDPQGQARVAAGVIAALNSVEPHVENFFLHDFFHANESWIEQFRPTADAMKERCLTSLAGWLGEKDYLENRFTAADDDGVAPPIEMAARRTVSHACGLLSALHGPARIRPRLESATRNLSLQRAKISIGFAPLRPH
jgi:glutathione S-transferase